MQNSLKKQRQKQETVVMRKGKKKNAIRTTVPHIMMEMMVETIKEIEKDEETKFLDLRVFYLRALRHV